MKKLSRRNFLKSTGTFVAGAAMFGLAGCGDALLGQDKTAGKTADAAAGAVGLAGASGGAAKVYFSDKIDADNLIRLYGMVNGNITGKTAIKLHTGEKNGPNILPRDMVRAFQQQVSNSSIVETNTFYHGDRDTTEKHRETLKVNGWTFCPVDIMDEDGAVMLPVQGGRHFKEMSVGKNLLNYDSMVVLTHFKGHTMGGFGGSLKNIAIGCADGPIGKRMQHGDGFSISQGPFQENMVEAAKAVVDHFGDNIVYINVMRRMSVDCDCAGLSAAEPTIPDIGILASTDLWAVDQASIDLVYKRPNNEKHDLVERIESREGLRQLSYMRELNMGAGSYELITIS